MMRLLETLENLSADLWAPLEHRKDPQASLSELERTFGLAFPADFRSLYERWNGGHFKGRDRTVLFYQMDFLFGSNAEGEAVPEYVPGMFTFASDNGDYVYFYDPAGKLGHDAYAVYCCELSMLSYEDAEFVASSITELVEKALGLDPVAD